MYRRKNYKSLFNAAVRFVFNITGKDKFDHITPYSQKLHFLPIQYRIKFKVCLLTYKCVQKTSPLYLTELIKIRIPNKNRPLRIDDDKLLLVKNTPEKQNYRNRSFSYVTPLFWNTLPINIRSSPSVSAFKTNLKTYFYSQWVSGEE